MLLVSILCAFFTNRKVSLSILGIAVLAGLAVGRIEWNGALAVLVLGLFLWWSGRQEVNVALRSIGYLLFLLLALLMTNHLVPGFNNLPVLSGVTFADDSIPFTMYLNFDKTVVGVLIYLLYVNSERRPPITKNSLWASSMVLLALILVLMPVALAIGYVRFDLKAPDLAWLWMLNNLFFVCLAEEGLFRGFIQLGIERIFPAHRLRLAFAILVGAVTFGLLHYKGGPAYIVLSGIAGVFYGVSYAKTRRIECAILVHFGFNAVHFFLFSYPALSKVL